MNTRHVKRKLGSTTRRVIITKCASIKDKEALLGHMYMHEGKNLLKMKKVSQRS